MFSSHTKYLFGIKHNNFIIITFFITNEQNYWWMFVQFVYNFLSRESEIKHMINYKLLLIYISLNKHKIT